MTVYFTIYQITHIDTSRIYIGYHKTKNLNDSYMGSGVHITRAIKAHGRDKFKKTILWVFDNEADMLAKEAELVTREFCLREDTYNMCLGGRGSGYSLYSPEQRVIWNRQASAIGAAMRRGQKDSEYTKQKRAASVSNSTRGVPKPWLNKSFIIDGTIYYGADSVAAATGVSRPTLLKRIKSNDWDWQYG